ncbi:MAG: hypothetical protein ACYTFD_14500 [Planctomycetota bacterium]|jgi:hypothetical protein
MRGRSPSARRAARRSQASLAQERERFPGDPGAVQPERAAHGGLDQILLRLRARVGEQGLRVAHQIDAQGADLGRLGLEEARAQRLDLRPLGPAQGAHRRAAQAGELLRALRAVIRDLDGGVLLEQLEVPAARHQPGGPRELGAPVERGVEQAPRGLPPGGRVEVEQAVERRRPHRAVLGQGRPLQQGDQRLVLEQVRGEDDQRARHLGPVAVEPRVEAAPPVRTHGAQQADHLARVVVGPVQQLLQRRRHLLAERHQGGHRVVEGPPLLAQQSEIGDEDRLGQIGRQRARPQRRPPGPREQAGDPVALLLDGLRQLAVGHPAALLLQRVLGQAQALLEPPQVLVGLVAELLLGHAQQIEVAPGEPAQVRPRAGGRAGDPRPHRRMRVPPRLDQQRLRPRHAAHRGQQEEALARVGLVEPPGDGGEHDLAEQRQVAHRAVGRLSLLGLQRAQRAVEASLGGRIRRGEPARIGQGVDPREKEDERR